MGKLHADSLLAHAEKAVRMVGMELYERLFGRMGIVGLLDILHEHPAAHLL